MANALSSSKVTILRMGFELTSVRRAFYLIVQPSHKTETSDPARSSDEGGDQETLMGEI